LPSAESNFSCLQFVSSWFAPSFFSRFFNTAQYVLAERADRLIFKKLDLVTHAVYPPEARLPFLKNHNMQTFSGQDEQNSFPVEYTLPYAVFIILKI
jgi:hypothetical protein